jgi:hypothetical protein
MESHLGAEIYEIRFDAPVCDLFRRQLESVLMILLSCDTDPDILDKFYSLGYRKLETLFKQWAHMLRTFPPSIEIKKKGPLTFHLRG